MSAAWLAIFLAGCSAGQQPDQVIRIVDGPALPVATSNNGVAAIHSAEGLEIFSFMGIGPGLSREDINSSSWYLPASATEWRQIADVPGPGGRLASSVAVVRGRIYVFGGYTVSEDGSETSTPIVARLDPAEMNWKLMAPMIVPVDDSVALVYKDRYVFLVSGWHDLGNVNLVQIYDVVTDSWVQGTPWPGEPVFGHAGGIVDNRLLVCDGVAVHTDRSGTRKFAAADQCFAGRIDPDQVRTIEWRRVVPHPGPPRYRMAASGSNHDRNEVVFAGGSDNPYNYDGIGYNGATSSPSAGVFSWRFDDQRWHSYGDLEVATMDHRNLIVHDNRYFIVGGMTAGPRVSPQLLEFALPEIDD